MHRLLLCVLFTLPAALDAEEPKPEPKAAEVAEVPPREEFFILPLRVYRLQAENFPAVHTKLEDADVERIVKKVNRVWAYAGITFGLESIRVEQADVAGFEKLRTLVDPPTDKKGDAKKENEKKPDDKEANPELSRELLAERNSRFFRAFIPEKTRPFDGFRVYYIQEFDVNGIYFGRREAMVKATAALRKVEGGIDEPLPRVTSHELGHGLGLPHRQDRTNLMQSGTTGTTLNTDEVKTTRALAEKTPGAIRYSDLPALIEKEADADRKALLQQWQAAVEEQAQATQ